MIIECVFGLNVTGARASTLAPDGSPKTAPTSIPSGFPANFPATISGPQEIFSPGTGISAVGIDTIACPSIGLCVAGDSHGRILEMNSAWTTSQEWDAEYSSPSGSSIFSISCPNITSCIATGKNGWTYTSSTLPIAPSSGQSSWTASQVDTPNSVNLVGCISSVLCGAVDSAGNFLFSSNAFTSTPTWDITEIDQTSANPPVRVGLTGLSCPSSTWCGAVDQSGNFLFSQNPFDRSPKWTSYNIDGGSQLTSLACVAQSPFYSCVASDVYGNLLVSTNPGNGAGSWSTIRIASSTNISSVTCPTSNECVAVSTQGKSLVNTDLPTDPGSSSWVQSPTNDLGASSVSCPTESSCFLVDNQGVIEEDLNTNSQQASQWSQVGLDRTSPVSSIACSSPGNCVASSGPDLATGSQVNTTSPSWSQGTLGYASTQTESTVNSIACPSSQLCVGVDSTGDVLFSENPTQGASSYNIYDIDLSTPINSVSCPNSTLCVAGDQRGNILVSSDPIGAASAWSSIYADPGHSIVSVSCPSTLLCIAIDDEGNVLESTDPTSQSPVGWSKFNLDGANQPEFVTCGSTTLCLIGDSYGNVISSTNPTGGASAWTVAGIDSQTPLIAGGCTSQGSCVLADSRGRVFANDSALSGSWVAGQLSGNTQITAFSCSQFNGCVAADNNSNEWLLSFSSTQASSSTNHELSAFSAKTQNLESHVTTSSFWHIPSSLSSSPVTGLSCASSTLCAAGTSQGLAFIYSGTTWSTATTLTASGTAVDSIDCIASSSQCVGVDATGHEYTYSGSWSSATLISAGVDLTSISCTSTSFCVATATNGDSYVYSTGAWSELTVASGVDLTSISCTSTSFCVATATNGSEYTYSGLSWSPTTIDPGSSLTSVSCPSTVFCGAVDSKGYFVEFNSGSWRSPVLIDGSGTLSLEAVSCPTSAFCGASDSIGDAVISSDPTGLAINTTTLNQGTLGVAYSASLSGSGGIGTISFSTGSSLPGGLVLSSSGQISGTPDVTGVYGITVTATDDQGNTYSTNITITVAEQPNLVITTVSLPEGQVGVPYSAMLSASGGTGLYTWSITTGTLPSGLTVSPQTGATSVVASSTGTISGTPTASGTQNIELEVTDTATLALVATGWFTITIAPSVTPTSFSTLTSSLPGAIVGAQYSVKLEAQGGSTPYVWSITTGTLPPGLGLSQGGLISGVPLAGGTYNVTVTAADSSNQPKTGQVNLSIIIGPIPLSQGLILGSSNGSQLTYGSAPLLSQSAGDLFGQQVVATTLEAAGIGSWETSSGGYVESFGDAGFFGSTGAMTLASPVVGIAATPSGHGYWLVASDGGVFAFGDAGFFGSTGAMTLMSPVVGIAATPSGQGYWEVTQTGIIESFGDADVFSTPGEISVPPNENAPVNFVGIAQG